MLKVKFKKMLKESGEQTDNDALSAIRTEFSKKIPNLELALSLARKSEMLMDYFTAHLKDLGILDRFINIHKELSKETPNLLSIVELAANNEMLKVYVGEHLEDLEYLDTIKDLDTIKEIEMELSKETPNFAQIIEKLDNNEALIAFYNQNEVFKEGCYNLGIEVINEYIQTWSSWVDAWGFVEYDPEGIIEYHPDVKLRLAEYYIERLKEVDQNPMDVLEQLTDLEGGTRMQDLGEYEITIDYRFLTPLLQGRLEDAIKELVDFRYQDLKDIEDWEDTARSSWYY